MEGGKLEQVRPLPLDIFLRDERAPVLIDGRSIVIRDKHELAIPEPTQLRGRDVGRRVQHCSFAARKELQRSGTVRGKDDHCTGCCYALQLAEVLQMGALVQVREDGERHDGVEAPVRKGQQWLCGHGDEVRKIDVGAAPGQRFAVDITADECCRVREIAEEPERPRRPASKVQHTSTSREVVASLDEIALQSMPINRSASMEALARDPLSGDSLAEELRRLWVKRWQDFSVFVYSMPYQPIDKLRILRCRKFRLQVWTRTVDVARDSTERCRRSSKPVHT